MKKLIGLFIFASSAMDAHASDVYLACQVLPVMVKESDAVDSLYTITDGGANIAVGSSKKKLPLVTSDQKYQWQWAAESNGNTLIVREEINRVTGQYAMYIDGPKGTMHVSKGTCRKAEPKL